MKYFRRFLALLMALLMCFALAACGSGSTGESDSSENSGSSGNSGSDSGANYDLGFNTWGSGSTVFDFMALVAEQAFDIAGVSGSRAIDNNEADTELSNIQNFISAGVDGIVMQVTAPTILPQVAEESAEAQIPFVLSTFTGNEEDRQEVIANNEYYAGGIASDLYAEGYLIGQTAAEAGLKSAVLIGGNVGDINFEQRIEGFTQSFVTEGGGEILDTARCASPAEGQEKANALLSAYGSEADMVYAMVGDYATGVISALGTLELDLPVYVTNANTDSIDYIKDGTIPAATSGNELVGAVAVALLVNYLDGAPITDEDGNPPDFLSTGFLLTNDNVDDFETVFGDSEGPYTAERLQTLFYRYNPDVTYDTFVDFIENQMNLDALIADRQ